MVNTDIIQVLLARIIRQGPQAPLPGDGFALPVYVYEAMGPNERFVAGECLLVAHLDADADAAEFSPGRVRLLELAADLPACATLLLDAGTPADSAPVWFCPRSQPAVETPPASKDES